MKFKKALVRRSLYTVKSRAFVWWSCKLKPSLWGKGKDTLVRWKVKKMFYFKIKKKNLKKKFQKKSKRQKRRSKKIEKQKTQKKIQKIEKGKKREKKKKKSLFLDRMCVFCLYPILDSQQCVKRGSGRCLILSGPLCSF